MIEEGNDTLPPTEVWICGQSTGGINWEFQGVFTGEAKAVAACRDENYFIFPIEVNRELPHRSVEPSRYKFPVNGGKTDEEVSG